VQFQKKISEFDNKGVTIIGISYDDVTVLRQFAEKYNITYPLLSDAGSQVIKKFGLLKQDATASKKGSGVPNPGLYVIDNNLTVLSKHFEKSYAARPSTQTVLITAFGDSARAGVQHFSTPTLDGQIALSDTTAYPAQVLFLSLHIKMRPGYHLYGRPTPEGYIPFSITIQDNDNFIVDEFKLPGGKPFKVDGLEEEFFILPGEFEVRALLRMVKKPQLGEQTITLNLNMQACSESTCFTPEKKLVELPVEVTRGL
jgi:hypothetical protein